MFLNRFFLPLLLLSALTGAGAFATGPAAEPQKLQTELATSAELASKAREMKKGFDLFITQLAAIRKAVAEIPDSKNDVLFRRYYPTLDGLEAKFDQWTLDYLELIERNFSASTAYLVHNDAVHLLLRIQYLCSNVRYLSFRLSDQIEDRHYVRAELAEFRKKVAALNPVLKPDLQDEIDAQFETLARNFNQYEQLPSKKARARIALLRYESKNLLNALKTRNPGYALDRQVIAELQDQLKENAREMIHHLVDSADHRVMNPIAGWQLPSFTSGTIVAVQQALMAVQRFRCAGVLRQSFALPAMSVKGE